MAADAVLVSGTGEEKWMFLFASFKAFCFRTVMMPIDAEEELFLLLYL